MRREVPGSAVRAFAPVIQKAREFSNTNPDFGPYIAFKAPGRGETMLVFNEIMVKRGPFATGPVVTRQSACATRSPKRPQLGQR